MSLNQALPRTIEIKGEKMDRRTFVKAAAVAPMMITAGDAKVIGNARWPEQVSLDNPIAHHYPVRFVESLPLSLRSYPYLSRFVNEAELFRFTAHEWHSEVVLFRGFQMTPREPLELLNQQLLDSKIGVYIDDYNVSDNYAAGNFMKEGGGPFPLRTDSTKALYSTMRGWGMADAEGCSDLNQFLGYFLPHGYSIVVKLEDYPKEMRSTDFEIKCDMARYTAKK